MTRAEVLRELERTLCDGGHGRQPVEASRDLLHGALDQLWEYERSTASRFFESEQARKELQERMRALVLFWRRAKRRTQHECADDLQALIDVLVAERRKEVAR